MLVSVILPNYNHVKFLEQRLNSIINQTYQNFEVILLDDASTDNSVKILKAYANNPKVSHFIINKQNSGSPFKQWKKGVDLAKGDYIWIAESDDYCEPHFLEKIFDFIQESDKELGLVYTQSIDINEEGHSLDNRISWTSEFSPNIWKENFCISGNEFIKKYLKVKNVIPNASSVIFKKSLIKEEIFSKEFLAMKMCGDWWFWVFILFKTNVGFVAGSFNYFREHETVSRKQNSKKRRIERLQEESIIRRNLQNYNIPQKKEIQQIYLAWFKLHSLGALTHKDFYKILIDKRRSISFVKSFIKHKLIAS